MSAARRKALAAALGMACAAALGHWATPTDKLADRWVTNLDQMFPASFGDWQVDTTLPVILPAPDIQEKLNKIYNHVLSRTYVNRNTGERVMMSVAYGGDQSDSMQAHLPEVCYPAQGFEVRQARSVVLDIAGRRVPARRMAAVLGGRHEPVTYWVTLGETVAATRTERKLKQMEYGLRGLVPDGMLIRVSTIDRDRENGFTTQTRFLQELASAIPPQHISRILGAA